MKLHNKISVVISTCILSGALFGLTFAVASETPGQGAVGSSIVLQDDGEVVSLVGPATNSNTNSSRVVLGTVEDLKARTGIDLSAPGSTRVTIAGDGMLPKVAQYLADKGVKVEDSTGGAVGWGGHDRW